MSLSLALSRGLDIELLAAFALLLTLAFALFRQLPFDASLHSAEKFGTRIADSRWAYAILAFFPVFLRLCLLPILPIPVPGISDEFSYLLAADTFAHGRLTNPSTPLWPHFQTSNVNLIPTYMSKYPPAQGAVLAAGQLLGSPWIGVLFSISALSIASFWMLKGWLPRRWAFLGALFLALRVGSLSYWANSYWGGAVPAIGGALILGAIPRLTKSSHRLHHHIDAALLALGLAILANSRPFEGLIFSIAVGVALFLTRSLTESFPALRRCLSLAALAILALTVAFMAYYNWRGTHNALVFPYTVNDKAYACTPNFIWQKPMPPRDFQNGQLQSICKWEIQFWQQNRLDSVSHFTAHVASVLGKCAYFYLWPQFLPVIAVTPFLFRDPKIRFFGIILALCAAGMIPVVWSQPHYAAPLTTALFLLLVQTLRHVNLWKYRGRPIGVSLVRTIVIFSVIMTGVYVVNAIRFPNLSSFVAPAGVWTTPGNRERANLIQKLNASPGNDLVIVRYETVMWPANDWVYNLSDLSHGKVIWAREISHVDNDELLRAFPGYRIWLVEPALYPVRITQIH
jgi:hypothetical protein